MHSDFLISLFAQLSDHHHFLHPLSQSSLGPAALLSLSLIDTSDLYYGLLDVLFSLLVIFRGLAAHDHPNMAGKAPALRPEVIFFILTLIFQLYRQK